MNGKKVTGQSVLSELGLRHEVALISQSGNLFSKMITGQKLTKQERSVIVDVLRAVPETNRVLGRSEAKRRREEERRRIKNLRFRRNRSDHDDEY